MDAQRIMEMGRKLQEQMEGAKEKVKEMKVSAASGGGMVEATVDGEGQLIGIKVDKTVFAEQDTELLEDMIIAAVAEAQKQAEVKAQQEIQKVTGGMGLPAGMIPGL